MINSASRVKKQNSNKLKWEKQNLGDKKLKTISLGPKDDVVRFLKVSHTFEIRSLEMYISGKLRGNFLTVIPVSSWT